MRFLKIATLLSLALLLTWQVAAGTFGDFIGDVVAKWCNNNRAMKLERDFAYREPSALTWTAPKASVVDGASIPRVFWTLIGGPFDGKYRNASVVHDVA